MSLLSLSGKLFCQGQYNKWYFGYKVALDFNFGSPVVIAGSVINANEGCASIADATGNLLFYTDGDSVWDKNNTHMPNGFGLLGNSTSTQSVLIVQQPGSNTNYYLFTAGPGTYAMGYHGIAYSVIDMTLNSGKGDVVVTGKNTLLLNSACEKLTAVKNCNGTYWVIVHQWNSDSFYAYLLTSAGVSAPVISHTGIVNSDNDGDAAIGYLKASPNGKKIASAIALSGNDSIGYVQLFDFNNFTGIISNPITIPYPNNGNSFGPYGVSFSPDNLKLYVSLSIISSFSASSILYQYDISSNNQATIIASQYIVNSSPTGTYYGSIQAAPDGKLYVAYPNNHSINVINNPNILGAGCNFVSNAVNLGSGSCALGLPNFVDAISPEPIKPVIVFHPACMGDTLDAGSGYSSYLWSPGGNTTRKIILNTPGTYTYSVTVSSPCGLAADTITVTVNAPVIDTTLQSQVICQDSNYYFYGTNLTTAGVYYHTLTSSLGCDSIIKLSLTVNPKETVSFTESPATGYVPLEVNFAYTGFISPSNAYFWTFGDGGSGIIENPIHIYNSDADTTFKVCLTVTYDICKSDTCQLVKVDVHSKITVPNVFTPNGDGINDEFIVRDTAIGTFNCVIFNRWGNKIYEWSDVKKGWDGKTENGGEAPDGTYYYIIIAKGYDNKKYNFHGVVTLIR